MLHIVSCFLATFHVISRNFWITFGTVYQFGLLSGETGFVSPGWSLYKTLQGTNFCDFWLLVLWAPHGYGNHIYLFVISLEIESNICKWHPWKLRELFVSDIPGYWSNICLWYPWKLRAIFVSDIPGNWGNYLLVISLDIEAIFVCDIPGNWEQYL